MSAIKQVNINNTLYDLDNRYIVLNGYVSGILTAEQKQILNASYSNYIVEIISNTPVVCKFDGIYYSGIDYSSNTLFRVYVGSDGAYTLTSSSIDTKNTAGSSNDTSKLYIVGAKSQSSTGVQTYSNSSVYEQSGNLYANQLTVTSDPTSDLQVATKQYVDNAIGDAIMASY